MNSPFTYGLPRSRIAQRPAQPYDSAKMLVVDRRARTVGDSTFNSITEYLSPTDLLVFNDSRVLRARLWGKLPSGGAVEILLLTCTGSTWLAMGKPLKKCKPGVVLEFQDGLRAEVGARISDHQVELTFNAPSSEVERVAAMPIPPYIRDGRADAQDDQDYQPHFAEVPGSVAAPTASLHFTIELMARIRALGCGVEFVTLHVGPPSFLPLEDGKPPGVERLSWNAELRQKLERHRASGGRVIAVGTTVVRALESMARGVGQETGLFITPGHQFLLVDALVTNFHQPGTTHLLLVEAFMGRTLLESSYQHALENDYRFLSYGDGMLII